ncbi:MAG: hypothetical protein K9J37_15290 [Saprospiraceae bacterium]|nr:hypothetical protein [Saprospiraceae bacterium]MCF8251275.1 hypothetical protein [Saprospiraceae bacterium]MCF8280834.1 hypothetical protein [Bacteroidales bacterium]MCF8311812.1 hypothetical protein [Saprospiraceae bacterium]MCF8441953.1 hypothetical protein [Saprospiraceae bacterium]
MNKKLFTLLFSLFLAILGRTQSLTGEWVGEVTQTGKEVSFRYTLSLTQTDNKVYGTATSSNTDGSGAAKFEVGGIVEGQQLILQEVLQLEPENARWCLKHIRLQLDKTQPSPTLSGNWEAQGCKPGTMKLVLSSPVGSGQSAPSQSAIHNPQSAIVGRFSGSLTQSDRDYGFYFEMEFKKDGTGTSIIVSDGEGGNATHRLDWTFDEAAQRLDFEETAIIEESVPSWRWCMKSGSLFYQKEKNRHSLNGNWQGYIEGADPRSGACAPGKLFVEQAIFEQNETNPPAISGEIVAVKPPEIGQYEKKNQRNVDVERVLEVKSKTVRIRVWDNGTVDGDVLSLFLNGDLIIKNYRVTRQKYETIVKLDKPTNFIILHALNVGSISPNTVAVSVDDGFGEQVVIISSNLKTSGAIMIREFTVK